MARAIWTGSINFGLVTVPVGLYSATEDHTVHFNQFERGTSDRIRYKRVNERTGKEVDFGDIVKGYDVGGGDYVIVDPKELDEIAPGRSRTIDIETFVRLDEIDPIYYQKTYWLAPSGEEFGRVYALLLEAMRKAERAAIGTFVMRGKEYLVAIRPDRDVLAMETMFFADEVRNPGQELETLPDGKEPRGKELDMAVSLIESMAGPWRPEDYHDTYTERVEKLIDDKRQGREVVTEAEPPSPTKVVDLMEALQRSVEAAQQRRGGAADGGARSEDLSSMSKADLDKLARQLDISGRSKMSRSELEKAVAEAQGSGARSRRRAS